MLVKLFVKAQNWFGSDEGATATEYGLLVGLIALIIVTGVKLFGQNLDAFFSDLATTVSGW